MIHKFRVAVFVFCTLLLFAPPVSAQPGKTLTPGDNSVGTASLTWDFFDPQPLLQLDSIRMRLGNSGTASDGLLFGRFSQQLDSVRLNLNDSPKMARYLQKAEVYMHGQFFLPAERAILFDAMGDKMLGKLSDTLEIAINAKIIDPESEDIAYLLRRLADDQHIINFKVNNRAKLWRYLKEGRFGYIFHKLTTTYKSEFFVFLGLLAFGLALIIYSRKRIVGFFKRKGSVS